MIHNCLWLKSLRITCRRIKELHNKFNSLFFSQNMSETGQNYPVSHNTQMLIMLFSRPLECVFTELNATTNSFCNGRKRRWQPCGSILFSEKTEDGKWIGKIILRPLLSPVQKMNTNLMTLFENWKKYRHKKVLSDYQNQACCRDHHCVLLHIPFQYILVIAVCCYPASMLHHRGVCSSVLVEEFVVCRDERHKDSRKWQKGKINLVGCPLISMVCCLQVVTPCRVQMLTHEYILPVSLFFPAVGFAMPPVFVPQEDIPYS